MSLLEFPSEKYIEDYVLHRMWKTQWCPISNEPVSFFGNQFEISGYGVADIIKFSVAPHSLTVTVLELKNSDLKERHLSQLCRYMRGVHLTIRRYRRLLSPGVKVRVLGQLAGPLSPASNDLVFLYGFLGESVSIYDLSLTMENGFAAKEVERGWQKNWGYSLSLRQKGAARKIVSQMRDMQTRSHEGEEGNG